MRQLLVPFDQTASLCGMRYLPPFVVYSALAVRADGDVTQECERYVRVLRALRDETLDVDAALAADELDESFIHTVLQ